MNALFHGVKESSAIWQLLASGIFLLVAMRDSASQAKGQQGMQRNDGREALGFKRCEEWRLDELSVIGFSEMERQATQYMSQLERGDRDDCTLFMK